MMKVNPIIGFLRTITLFLTGKVNFIKNRVGKEIITKDGIKFKVLRHVVIHSKKKKINLVLKHFLG